MEEHYTAGCIKCQLYSNQQFRFLGSPKQTAANQYLGVLAYLGAGPSLGKAFKYVIDGNTTVSAFSQGIDINYVNSFGQGVNNL